MLCKEREIPAYLERSRSGEGGHVWIFFDQSPEGTTQFANSEYFNELPRGRGIL